MTSTKNNIGAKANTNLKELLIAIKAAESIDECQKFLEDLCTPAELRSMADRWQVARLLDHNVPYRSIYEKTGVSTTTITRVARALAYGKGGYNKVLKQVPCEPLVKATQ